MPTVFIEELSCDFSLQTEIFFLTSIVEVEDVLDRLLSIHFDDVVQVVNGVDLRWVLDKLECYRGFGSAFELREFQLVLVDQDVLGFAQLFESVDVQHFLEDLLLAFEVGYVDLEGVQWLTLLPAEFLNMVVVTVQVFGLFIDDLDEVVSIGAEETFKFELVWRDHRSLLEFL